VNRAEFKGNIFLIVVEVCLFLCLELRIRLVSFYGINHHWTSVGGTITARLAPDDRKKFSRKKQYTDAPAIS
jgi:hypothetical protein